MDCEFSTSTLSELQSYVRKIEAARGFAHEGVLEKCLLLGEEVGELYKAVRREGGLRVDPTSERKQVADELADVMIFLLAIANRYDIDLAAALQSKEIKNQGRNWTR